MPTYSLSSLHSGAMDADIVRVGYGGITAGRLRCGRARFDYSCKPLYQADWQMCNEPVETGTMMVGSIAELSLMRGRAVRAGREFPNEEGVRLSQTLNHCAAGEWHFLVFIVSSF